MVSSFLVLSSLDFWGVFFFLKIYLFYVYEYTIALL